MKIIIAAALCALLSSCAGLMAHVVGMRQEDSAYRIVPKNFGENRAVAVFYGPDYLKEKENKRAEVEMREPDYAGIQKHGYISIRIQDSTASAANTKQWLFILQDADKNEIYRSYGGYSPPHKEASVIEKRLFTTYWNLHHIYLEDDYAFPLYLRVVNMSKEAVDIVIQKK